MVEVDHLCGVHNIEFTQGEISFNVVFRLIYLRGSYTVVFQMFSLEGGQRTHDKLIGGVLRWRVTLIFLETPHLRSFIPHPKTDFGTKSKRIAANTPMAQAYK